MRVIAGTARSIPLLAPEGMDTRPTTDKIKETLFNMIQFDIQESIVLDLFAGSGALGIEALSRGAKMAYFSDNAKAAVDIIEKNVKKCHFEDRAKIMRSDALGAVLRLSSLKGAEEPVVVFLDPPYDQGLEFPVLKNLISTGIIRSDSLVILETSIGADTAVFESMGYSIRKEKLYKNQKHVFLEKA